MKLDFGDLDWRESHELLTSIIVPRPIALVSTVGETGIFNVAPFSAYGMVCMKPALVFLGIGLRRRPAAQKKDTIKNIEFSKDFVINVVTESLAEPMNQSAYDYPSDVSEFKEVGLTAVKSDLVKSPRVGESPISMECKLKEILQFGETPNINNVVIGEAVRVHVRDDLWVNNEIQTSKLKVIARLGGDTYCRSTDLFEMKKVWINVT